MSDDEYFSDHARIQRIVARLGSDVKNVKILHFLDDGEHWLTATTAAGELVQYPHPLRADQLELFRTYFPHMKINDVDGLDVSFFTKTFNQWDRARKVAKVLA